jgi:uncharacterized membrane protein
MPGRPAMHASARLVVPMAIVALALPVPPLLGWDYAMPLPYAWHKTLHVLGAVLFLGNVATGALWGALAVYGKDPRTVRFALSTINWSDAVFTGPGVLLLMYNGLAMAGSLGGLTANAFTAWGLSLFYAVILAWILVVVPDQHRILARAGEAAEGSAAFRGAVLRWNIIGSLAGGLAVVVLVLMVLKP